MPYQCLSHYRAGAARCQSIRATPVDQVSPRHRLGGWAEGQLRSLSHAPWGCAPVQVASPVRENSLLLGCSLVLSWNSLVVFPFPHSFQIPYKTEGKASRRDPRLRSLPCSGCKTSDNKPARSQTRMASLPLPPI
uniref:Uncharacterized protein n=1 Tax=Corvus moneduloides TaxID=1196302 RepID=A0A8C3DAW6_CORMO